MLVCHGQSIALWCFSGGKTTMSDNTWPALTQKARENTDDGAICLLITFSVSWDTTNKQRFSLWRPLFNRVTTELHDFNITTSSLCSRPCHLLLHESLCQWQLWLNSSTKPTQVSYSLKVLSGKNSAELIPKTEGTIEWKHWELMRNMKAVKF